MAQSPEQSSEQEGQLVEMEERRWLPRHLQGDGQAFTELVKAYRAPVYNYLLRCGVEGDTRDDLFQEVFLKVHRAAASYQPSRPLKPWLFTIAANTVRNHFRRRRVDAIAFQEKGSADLPSPGPGPERLVEAGETLHWLEGAVAALPLPQREVLVLTCFEEMDQNGVAAALQIPVNTVKTHLRRARLTLCRERARRNGEEKS